jgi:hypothetical protein
MERRIAGVGEKARPRVSAQMPYPLASIPPRLHLPLQRSLGALIGDSLQLVPAPLGRAPAFGQRGAVAVAKSVGTAVHGEYLRLE